MKNSEGYKIMTGAIFESDPSSYPQKVQYLNDRYVNKVAELYGSLRHEKLSLPTARPDFRIPDVSTEYLVEYVNQVHKCGMQFNYTMNSNFIGSLENISSNYTRIVDGLKFLESEVKIDRITVAHPILLDIVCRHTDIPIEVSTILNVNQLSAPAELKKRYPNINKICMGIDKNRNISFVDKMRKVCKSNSIDLEIMVSEFCAIGTTSCTQLHRNTCYNMHSLNMPEETARFGTNGDGSKQPKEISGYPWTSGNTGCIFGRAAESVAWLTSKTVWPNEIEAYCNATGINHIKVTNRTAPPEFALFLTEAYLSGKYDNLLAGLWLALPASTLSARGNFEKLQKAGENTVPFSCSELSEKRSVMVKIPFVGNIHVGNMSFFDLFLTYPKVSWDDVVWVDKPDDQLESHECNWAHKWVKMLNENK